MPKTTKTKKLKKPNRPKNKNGLKNGNPQKHYSMK